MIKSLFAALTLATVACGGSQAPAPAAPAPQPAPAPASSAAPPVTASSTGPDKAALAAAELAAYEKAKPVFEHYCASCHTTAGEQATHKKLAHFSMDSYPFGGEHARSIGNEIRVVLGIDGGKPTMPDGDPGAVKGEDLALVKAWTEAWRASGAAGNHPAEPAEKDDD